MTSYCMWQLMIDIGMGSVESERVINGGPGRIAACIPVGCQRLASLMTKIDGINFEYQVLCDAPLCDVMSV